MEGLPVIAITMGDPAGIGPELSLRMLTEPAVLAECIPLVFGDAGVLDRVAQVCSLPRPEHVLTESEWTTHSDVSAAAVMDCATLDAQAVRPGEVDAACGRAAYRYIEAAIESALAGKVAGVATAPVHKEALRLARVPYPGHTEIFAALTSAQRACMMLASDEITTSFVTCHVGFVDVTSELNTPRILDVIELTAEAMMRLRGQSARILVCGLNPHNGEHGLFGRQEEEKVIGPAVAAARARGLNVEGPISPDAAFLPDRRRKVDAYVCMYHDQGHIPFKMLAFDKGVNITLGLPIIRTSVDHGTAFDIAWSGRADDKSMIQAVLWAARLAGARKPLALNS